jgi:predicted  nucleic acid-binding Zn-ribbon protein
MNDAIRSLLALQEKDLELDRLTAGLAAIPGKIAALQSQIQAAKTALEDAKKESTQLQMIRKQKELDLETHETAIRKYSLDLNAVKTNDAYRALLGEIEKAKKEKSTLEDQILLLMEQSDQASRVLKEKEAAFKRDENDLLKQIADWETKQKELQQQIAERQAQRSEAVGGLPQNIAEHYERVRRAKKGAALVPIHKEQCSGCHMKVSQNLINEVRRGQKLIPCESCSRIVYLEESAVPT